MLLSLSAIPGAAAARGRYERLLAFYTRAGAAFAAEAAWVRARLAACDAAAAPNDRLWYGPPLAAAEATTQTAGQGAARSFGAPPLGAGEECALCVDEME